MFRKTTSGNPNEYTEKNSAKTEQQYYPLNENRLQCLIRISRRHIAYYTAKKTVKHF